MISELSPEQNPEQNRELVAERPIAEQMQCLRFRPLLTRDLQLDRLLVHPTDLPIRQMEPPFHHYNRKVQTNMIN